MRKQQQFILIASNHNLSVEDMKQGMRYEFGSAGASWRALDLKTAEADSTRTLKR